MLFKFLFITFICVSCISREQKEQGSFSDNNHKIRGIVYPPEAEAVIDLTKPPYNLDNTGREDCTEGLIKAFDDIVMPTYRGMQKTREKLNENPEAVKSFETRPGRIIFPEELAPSKILYFPNGIYLLSNTITYTLDSLHNSIGMELARQIHFQGQSREHTILKLKDSAPGFEEGRAKPLIDIMKKGQSNVAMSNTVEDLTIDIGQGNPGAIGLQFFANNTGAVRNVIIRSSDPDGAGHVGLDIGDPLISGVLIKNVDIQGFDRGIKVSHEGLSVTFEHLKLQGQKQAGFYVDGSVSIAVRDYNYSGNAPAVVIENNEALLNIIDSDFKGDGSSHSAIDIRKGYLFARDVGIEGFSTSVVQQGEDVASGNIGTYVSHDITSTNEAPQPFALPVKETPEPEWISDFTKWAGVNEFGANGMDEKDDTEAIRAAMRSGKPVIYFQPGKYIIDGTIKVPATVERVNFMYANLKAGENLKKMRNKGAFEVNEFSETPLIFEDLFAWEEYYGLHYLINHASKRTVVLSDLHTQVGAQYINTVEGGEVFIENVCTTDESERRNCFTFNGQKVWARQINPERSNPQIKASGTDLWILGIKTEGNGTSFELTDSRAEILGGVINNFSPVIPEGRIAFINNNSEVVYSTVTRGRSDEGHYFKHFIREQNNGKTFDYRWEDFPRRYKNQTVIPLYVFNYQ